METEASFLLTLGGVLLLGLVTSSIGHRTFLPRVTLLLIFGVIIGQGGLDIIPPVFSEKFELIAETALLMVGFLLGGKLTVASFRQSMSVLLWVSISAALVTTIVVSSALYWFGVPLEAAILLGCMASATDPAAIFDAASEAEYKGNFRSVLFSVVAVDDAWALVLFGTGVAISVFINGYGTEVSPYVAAFRDIGGAVALGLLIGFPAAFLTGRLKPGQPMLSEALGVVFICGGLAAWLDVSFLIAAMVLGAVVANFARHHEYPFHAIEGVESQLIVIFFVLAGASLDIEMLYMTGLGGIVYVVSRIAGKLLGARIGGECSRADKKIKNWMGVALLPQAGVAIGMALVASGYFPEHRQIFLSVAISSTIFFEIVGPVFTRMALVKTMD